MTRLMAILSCALLACTSAAAAEPAPKRLLLIGQGPDGHPAASHEYYAGLKILEQSLAPAKQVTVKQVQADGEWREGPELLAEADGVVLYLAEGAKWVSADPRRHDALTKLAARGGGLVTLHWAMGTKDAEPIEAFQKLFGGCHGGADRKYKVLETSVAVAAPEHPATRGLTEFTIKDEFYYKLKFVDDKRLIPLLTAKIDGEAFPVAWAWEREGGGRSFGFSGLHYHKNWRREEYRRFVAQGVLWSLAVDPPRDGFPGEVRDEDYKLP
jgi:type 1 glutamine amidotransferase